MREPGSTESSVVCKRCSRVQRSAPGEHCLPRRTASGTFVYATPLRNYKPRFRTRQKETSIQKVVMRTSVE
jgi:hypothetical protein